MTFSSPLAAGLVFGVSAVVSLAASFVLASRLERIVTRAGLSQAILGLVIALGADSPEVTSAITASSSGHRSIGVGVVLGSNVFNLAALLGLASIVAGTIRMHRRAVLLEGCPAVWIAVVTVLALSARLDPVVALGLVLVVIVPYLVMSAFSAGRIGRLPFGTRARHWLEVAVAEEQAEQAQASRTSGASTWDGPFALLSLIVVVIASVAMERAASQIGQDFHLTSLVVGGVILAAVTSLPNAVGAVYLVTRGKGAAVLSEAMNSNLLNVVVGLLIPATVVGLPARTGSGLTTAAWYAVLTVVSLVLAVAGRGLTRRSGLVIVVGYLAFVVVALTR